MLGSLGVGGSRRASQEGARGELRSRSQVRAHLCGGRVPFLTFNAQGSAGAASASRRTTRKPVGSPALPSRDPASVARRKPRLARNGKLLDQLAVSSSVGGADAHMGTPVRFLSVEVVRTSRARVSLHCHDLGATPRQDLDVGHPGCTRPMRYCEMCIPGLGFGKKRSPPLGLSQFHLAPRTRRTAGPLPPSLHSPWKSHILRRGLPLRRSDLSRSSHSPT
jgi:hypothetical protein